VVTLDPGGRVVALHARVPDVAPPPAPVIDAVEAGRRASEALGRPLVAAPRAALWLDPAADGARLVWRVELFGSLGGHWRVTLDARSGAVLAMSDLRRQARAQVWEHNAANSELVEVVLPEIEAGDTVLSSSLVDASTVVWEGSSASSAHLAAPDEQGDFWYDPDDAAPVFDDPFAEVNAYWHLAAVRQWFSDTWGHTFAGTTTVLTNYSESPGDPYDNAFFSLDWGGGYLIAVGQGTVDLAYDADVLQHEFGHGVVEDLCAINAELDYPISFDEYGLHASVHAINEGMADYWSSTFQGDACSAEYFGSAFGMACLRDLDNDRRAPDDILGEAHEDGMIVGGTCWAIREAVGAAAADDAIYGALGALTSGPTFLEYAEAIAEHAAVLAEEGALTAEDLAAIDAILTERGWRKAGRAIALAEGQVEHGVFLGADLISLYMGSTGDAVCNLARSFQGGLVFPLPFQFSFTVPEDREIEAVDIDFGLTPWGGGGAPGEDDLQYAFYARRGEMITFQEYNLQDLIGYDFTILDEVLGYDLVVDDQPAAVRLEADDPDLPLVPGETYYFDLAGMNCPLMDFEVSVAFVERDPPPEEECGCGRRAAPGVGLLGSLGALLLVRRRRAPPAADPAPRYSGTCA
jgi:hypothetical protein